MLAHRIDGVDLSPLMIERAKARGIYGELAVDDLEDFLENSRRQYDLLIAADAVVYFGDLSRLFRGVHANLKPNGNFLFTVEKQADARLLLRAKASLPAFAEIFARDCRIRWSLLSSEYWIVRPGTDDGEPVEGLAVALHRA